MKKERRLRTPTMPERMYDKQVIVLEESEVNLPIDR